MVYTLVVGMMSTNSFIHADENGGCIIVDPGGDADKILQKIAHEKLRPLGIVCTHGHLDHVGAVGPLMSRYEEFEPPLFLAIHEADSRYLGERGEKSHERSLASMGLMGTGYFQMLFKPSPEPTILLGEGDTVPRTGFEVIHTPGHTEGSICLLDRKEKILFSGDTIFNRGIGRTDLEGGDYDSIMKSIREKLMELDDDIRIFPGHGPETTIGNERIRNPFLRT